MCFKQIKIQDKSTDSHIHESCFCFYAVATDAAVDNGENTTGSVKQLAEECSFLPGKRNVVRTVLKITKIPCLQLLDNHNTLLAIAGWWRTVFIRVLLEFIRVKDLLYLSDVLRHLFFN